MPYIEGLSTIEDVRLAISRKAQEETPRSYIGASQLGAECDRQTWYAGRGEKGKPWPVETLLKFEDGHRTESLMAERLRLLPNIRLYGEQTGFDLGFMKGHVDGIIEGLHESATPHIWECKAVSEDNYKKLQKQIELHGEKMALKFWNNTYYVQAVIYMHCMGYTRHYMTVATAGGRDFLAIRTNENPKYAEALLDKAKRLARMEEPPNRIGKRDFYLCKMCKYQEVCHGK